MREAAPGLRAMPSSAAAAARPWPRVPPRAARPIAMAAPIARAEPAVLPSAPAACANAEEGIRVNNAMASATFFLDIIIDSLIYPCGEECMASHKVTAALVRFVFGSQPNIDASQ